MKRILMVLALACATLILAQCKKQIVEQPSVTPTGETIEVSLNADNGSSKTIIDGTTIKWRVGDKLHVVGETNGYLGFISAQNEGASAYFTGTITKPAASSQTLHFYYIGDENKVFSLVGDNYTYDISTQTGTLSDIEDNLHLMHGQVAGVASGTTNLGTITMTSMMSIAKLQFSKTGNIASTITCYGAIPTATLDTKTGILTPVVADLVTLNGVGQLSSVKDGETVSNDYYMVLLPGSQTFTFANEVLGDVCKSVAKTVNVVANKFYTSNTETNIAVTVELNKLDGALPGRFTVGTNSKGAKVYTYFSKGNLQYKKSTGVWNFAEHQYDIVEYNGLDVGNNYANYDIVGLFCYGTSGYNCGQNCYMPTSTSVSKSDYFAANLVGEADWGYNAIENGGNAVNLWHTLNTEEWKYLLNTRKVSVNNTQKDSYGVGVVNDKNGLIILPDSWNGKINNNLINFYYGNSPDNTWKNTFTGDVTWSDMESAGAVFIPAAGDRPGTVTRLVNEKCYCSTSSYVYREKDNHWYQVHLFIGESSGIIQFFQSDCDQGRAFPVRVVNYLN